MTRIVIAIAILFFLNGYVAARIAGRWPWAAHHMWVVAALTALFVALQLVAPLGNRLFFPDLKRQLDMDGVFVTVDWLSYGALGLLSCLFMYMVPTDVISVLWKWVSTPSRPVDFDRRTLLTLGLVTLGSAAVGIRQAMAGPVVKDVEIPLSGLPAGFDGFRIAQVSDLHTGQTIGRDYVENVVKIVNDLKPDLIALTGDVVDGPVEDVRSDVAPLAQLKAPHGVFFVTGNHEYFWDAAAWMYEIAKFGTRVLVNEHEVIRRNGDEIILAGVTDYSTRTMSSPHASNPRQALEGAPPDRTKILLAHQPASYEMASAAGFDLQLSGHTHAGQYFPVSLLIGFFQRYYKGLNRHENMWIYVNSGTGYWGPPMRTGNPSEITLLTLRAAPAS
jgi:hypothetical protein